MLFFIFVNDLPECMESIYCTIFAFADDTKNNSSDKFEIMQNYINALQKWSNLLQLFFSSTKCKCIY